jgi:hypothetical protein
MGRNDARGVADIERRESIYRVAHRRPVGLRPHDDGDRRFRLPHSAFLYEGKPCGIDDGFSIGKRAICVDRGPISLRESAAPALRLHSILSIGVDELWTKA